MESDRDAGRPLSLFGIQDEFVNYFAHGVHYLDNPYFLAGTAAPDWLSVADRKTRLRKRNVEPFLTDPDSVQAAVAAGVCRHLDDDAWFHRTPAFYEVSGALTRKIREVLGTDDGFRCSFLGHITTELLLDAVLIEREPQRLDRYYETLDAIDFGQVQQAVNAMVRHPSMRLAKFIGIFVREQFLRDYSTDERLLYRLNQVMRRVSQKPLPEELLPALAQGREIVREHATRLLGNSLEDEC